MTAGKNAKTKLNERALQYMGLSVHCKMGCFFQNYSASRLKTQGVPQYGACRSLLRECFTMNS